MCIRDRTDRRGLRLLVRNHCAICAERDRCRSDIPALFEHPVNSIPAAVQERISMVLKSYCPTDLEQFFPIEMLQDRLYYRHGQFELLGNPFCRTVRVGINSLQGQVGKEAKLQPRAFSTFDGGWGQRIDSDGMFLSLIHISEPTRQA